MRGPPCPACWMDERLRAERAGELEHDLSYEERMAWEPSYGGTRVLTPTRWDGGCWRCASCDLLLTPRDAGLLLSAVLAVAQVDAEQRCEWIRQAWRGRPGGDG